MAPVRLLLLFLTFTGLLWPQYDCGFNFRATDSYVTDDPGQTYVLGSDTSLTTRGCGTFEWNGDNPSAANRNAGTDPRLAGINYVVNAAGKTTTFAITLPATGDYEIHAAIGDYNSQQINQTVKFQDNTSTFLTLGPLANTGGGQRWYDATGVLRVGVSTWQGSEALTAHTFTSTTFNVNIGDNTAGAGESTCLAHIRVFQVVSGVRDFVKILARFLHLEMPWV